MNSHKKFAKVIFLLLTSAIVSFAASSIKVFNEAEKYSVKVYVTTIVAIEQSERGSAQGSGFIVHIDKNEGYAYVATCQHVIGNGIVNTQISFKDGERIQAEAIYIDPVFDFGMIRFKLDEPGVPDNVAAARLGNSKRLKIGDRVGTFGNPGGLEFSGTEGIVSSTSNTPSSATGTFIQTDAPINFGNSGGPLIRMSDGTIIGINAFTSGQGIGWALAINQLKPIIDEVIAGNMPYAGRVGWMGFDLTEITTSRAQESFKTKLPKNVRKALLIRAIAPSNEADAVGIQSGDIIVSVNGKAPIDNADYTVLMKKFADKLCTLKISRFGEEKVFKLVAYDRASDRPKEYISIAGMTIQPMSRLMQYNYDMDSAAVYISDVEEQSSAASWGVVKDWPVRAVAVKGKYHRITTFDGFWEAVKGLKPGEPLELFYGYHRIYAIVKVVYYDESESPIRKQVPEPKIR